MVVRLSQRLRADRRNVPVVSHAQYVLTVTAAPSSRVRPRWVKRPGDLDLWPWKWCRSRVTWATFVPILVFLDRPVCSRLSPDVRDRQTWDRQTRQTASSVNAPAWAGAQCKSHAKFKVIIKNSNATNTVIWKTVPLINNSIAKSKLSNIQSTQTIFWSVSTCHHHTQQKNK